MKLAQVIAAEKGVKATANKEIDAIHKAAQKPALYDGFVKTYKPYAEDDPEGKTTPPQKQNVQRTVAADLKKMARLWTDLIDINAQRDWANCQARADVVVEGVPVVGGVPVTHLLFLEKQVTDIRTIVASLPVLDPAERWEKDASAGLSRTAVTMTQRTKKVQEALTLVPPTKEHPGQAQIITKDVVTGNWEQTLLSGCIAAPAKEAMLERADKLLRAIKQARAEANTADAPERAVGEKVFSYILEKEV